MATVKRYPFSMRRYGHNIELAYNHFYCAECYRDQRNARN